MSESWLEIEDKELDAGEIQRRIEARLARRGAEDLRACPGLREALGQADSAAPAEVDPADTVSRWLRDCDLLPARYEIDWRVPIVGPIHAAVRRLINAEIRRFLLPSLVKQSHLNRAVLRLLRALEQENARLRQEVARLRCRQEGDD